jgi:hypothetical protein
MAYKYKCGKCGREYESSIGFRFTFCISNIGEFGVCCYPMPREDIKDDVNMREEMKVHLAEYEDIILENLINLFLTHSKQNITAEIIVETTTYKIFFKNKHTGDFLIKIDSTILNGVLDIIKNLQGLNWVTPICFEEINFAQKHCGNYIMLRCGHREGYFD